MPHVPHRRVETATRRPHHARGSVRDADERIAAGHETATTNKGS